ncbi:MAG: MBL fold metallo-hydrolase [Armatimonadetes bacterium]|nr:MBL fold metallo-hydrolase [Armatimonadota bacterium]
MMLTVHSLASGSSGNCILIRSRDSAVLIDAGIGIRRIVAALYEIEMSPRSLSGILITHEHTDHTAGAVRMARRYGVPLISNAPTLAGVTGSQGVPHEVLDIGSEMAIGDLSVRSFPVSHDAACPTGYTIECGGKTICNATDTGILTQDIRAEAVAADLLILESNHDVKMLVAGPYPWFLKRRIMGSNGHLSNESAAALLLEIAQTGRSVAVWLAHLSKMNNTPAIALETARSALAGTDSPIELHVAMRDFPSIVWRAEA